MVELYRWLYHVTFVPHLLCAAYVVGGTAWLVVLGLRGCREGRDRIADALRDWLPFVLGLAITFGVGPLLFVQMLDGPAFYTANLLLSHRFMVLLPALILGFYLLYVQKAGWAWTRRRAARAGVPALALLCFGYAAWSWSRNHLLAERPETWPVAYVNAAALPAVGDVLARLWVFVGLALQSSAMFVLLHTWRDHGERALRRSTGLVGGIGAVVTSVALWGHGAVRGMADATTPMVSLLVMQAVLVIAWLAPRRSVSTAMVIGAATVLAFERVAWLRETVWRARMGGAEGAGYEQAGGTGLFFATLVSVVVVIVWCVLRVRRDLRAV